VLPIEEEDMTNRASCSADACVAVDAQRRWCIAAAPRPRRRRRHYIIIFALLLARWCGVARAADEVWDYKKEFLHYLTASVPKLLKDQNKTTGAWGSEPWIVTDQNCVFPLAAAWEIQDSDNPWYHKGEVLDAVMLG